MKNIEKINRRNMMIKNLIGFAIDMKDLVKRNPKSRIITVAEIEELFNKWDINKRELEKLR